MKSIYGDNLDDSGDNATISNSDNNEKEAQDETSRKKGAREYMCSKPASLPFVDDSPPRSFAEIESPSEARIAERLATAKSPLKNSTKVKITYL